jgi:hypothetical protein
MKPTMCGHTRRTSRYLVLRSVSHYKSPFNAAPHRQAHPERREEGLLDTTLLRPSLEPACVPSGSLSTLSPYSRKPSPFGPKMSIFAKGVSRGVHNIAFLLSPDRFCAFTLFFLLHTSSNQDMSHKGPSKSCKGQKKGYRVATKARCLLKLGQVVDLYKRWLDGSQKREREALPSK